MNQGTEQTRPDFNAKLHAGSHIKQVIAVVSGKGGVGKSLVTSMLAAVMGRSGLKVGILDADITGPSIPKAFGLATKALGQDGAILPVKTAGGIKVMSINLLLSNATDPVIWRGPLVGGMVKQFWSDVVWGDLDYLLIDLPPGTGDVPLTVFQSFAIDGVVLVTSPQELVSMIVSKAVNMAESMHIPMLGIIENMAYFLCPDCGSKHYVFGESHVEKIAKEHNLPVLGQIPMDPAIAAACDAGSIERLEKDYVDQLLAVIEEKTARD